MATVLRNARVMICAADQAWLGVTRHATRVRGVPGGTLTFFR